MGHSTSEFVFFEPECVHDPDASAFSGTGPLPDGKNKKPQSRLDLREAAGQVVDRSLTTT